MEQAIADRITVLEETLGISDSVSVKSSDLDVSALIKSLEHKGFNHILKTPIDELKRVRSILETHEKENLAEMISNLVIAEKSLIEERATMLGEFYSKLDVVLDCANIKDMEEKNKILEDLERETDKVVTEWREHCSQIQTFVNEYLCLVQGMVRTLTRLEAKVTVLEMQRKRLGA